MPERVLVAMSGGVDSSVAALLLRRAGHDVVGVFMRNGVSAGEAPRARSCCSASDAYDARRVAHQLGVPFYVLNFEREFARLIDEFCAEYDRGATPNPCILCNQRFKFGRLFAYAEAAGAGAVATGHYARVASRADGGVALRRGADRAKDQSYVLFALSQPQLARTRFPLGDMTKAEVRAAAREAGLPVMDKPESQEICFVPDDDYRTLLKERIPERLREGEMRHVDGRALGRHPGHQFFTVGQRHGLGLALGRPAYVVRIEAETNTVVVGEAEDVLAPSCAVERVNWIAPPPAPGAAIRADVQIRSQHRAAPAAVTALDGARAEVRFESPQRAVTPGQAAVFYDGDEVVGGGWIALERAGFGG